MLQLKKQYHNDIKTLQTENEDKAKSQHKTNKSLIRQLRIIQVKLEQSIDFLKTASRELVSTDVQFFTKPRIENLVKKIDSFVGLISRPETSNESAYDSPSNDEGHDARRENLAKQLYMVPPTVKNGRLWSPEADDL